MRRFLLKALKIASIILIGIFVVFLILIHIFFQQKSDEEIISVFKENSKVVVLESKNYNGNKFRFLSLQKEIDTTLPNIVFVHGSPGSSMDFKNYLLDVDLNNGANIFAYDRIGYNVSNSGKLLPIADEVEMLEKLINNLEFSNTIIVGYSYGGPIALGVKEKFKKIILCAPAVVSEVEPMFWFLNLYKWKATRWLMPDMLKTASKEKLGHANDLKALEPNWGENPSPIKIIHGDKDWIVPYENSLIVQKQFPPNRFELITLKGASHDLIWSRFDEVKREILNVLVE